MLALKHSKITGAILKAFFDIFNDLSGFPDSYYAVRSRPC